MVFCIIAVVALPNCLEIFWIKKGSGDLILLFYPPQVVCDLISFGNPGRGSPWRVAQYMEW